LFPWTQIFRAPRVALSFRKVVLGAVVFALFDALASAWKVVPATELVWPAPGGVGSSVRWLLGATTDPGTFVSHLTRLGSATVTPVMGLFRLIVTLLDRPTWSTVGLAVASLVLWLLVWGIAGCALSRLAAVEIAKSERASLASALRMGLRYVFDLVYAPGLPMLAAAFLGLIAVGFAAICRIPGAGPAVVGGLWCIPLALGFGMLIVLIGATAGWPLMVAGIAVERSDGFDGLSRAYGYIYDRPWHFVWFVIVAIVVGGIGLFAVSCAADLGVLLADGSAAWGLAPDTIAPAGVRVWHTVIAYLVQGYVASYFWSASTIVYMLLRQSSDGVQLTELDSGEPPTHEGLQSLARERATLPIIDAPPVQPPPVEPPPVEPSDRV
jgi:hypothetical protein